MEAIRVLIADDQEETRKNVRRLLAFESRIQVVGEASDGDEAVAKALEIRPDVLLMDVNMPGSDGLRATQKLRPQLPECQIVIMSVQGEHEYLRRAMLAGARDYLIKPFSPDQLMEAITSVHRLSDEKPTSGRVVTVFGPKGGVGRSTVAANLGLALAKRGMEKVVLWDLDLEWGDQSLLMDLKPQKNISHWVRSGGELEGILSTHASGLRVLSAPYRPEEAEEITTQAVSDALESLRSQSNMLIIDTPSSFREEVLAVMDGSDEILALTTADLVSIKSLRLALDVMENLGYQKISVLVNQYQKGQGLSFGEMEKGLGRAVNHYLPLDTAACIQAVQQGSPVVWGQPRSRLASAYMELTDQWVPAVEEKKLWPFRLRAQGGG